MVCVQERSARSRSAVALAVAASAVLMGSAAAMAAISVDAGNPDWKVAFDGSGNDYVSDQQTGQGDSDFVGGVYTNSSGLSLSYSSMYWYFAPGTTSTDGTLYFRLRVDGKDGGGSTWAPDSVYFVGLDFATGSPASFGKMDMFLALDTKKGNMYVTAAGYGANTSPSTTTIDTTAFGGTIALTPTNYNFSYATQMDPRSGALYDLGGTVSGSGVPSGNGATDGFLSFSFPFSRIVQAAASTSNNLPGVTINNLTPMMWGIATATQNNTLNQDINGVNNKAPDYNTITWSTVYTNQGLPTTGVSPIRSTYRLAAPSPVTPNPVNLGNVRVGSPFSTRSLTLSNTAANDGTSEGLNATITTGGSATASGSVNRLNPGSSSTNLVVGLTTPASAGVKQGTAAVSLSSDGAGTSGAGTTALPSQSVTITGTAYDYAKPTGLPASIAFGNVRPGTTISRTVTVGNQVVTNAAYQDSLNVTLTPGNGKLSGQGLTALAAGSSGTVTLTANVSQPGSLADSVSVGLVSNANGVPGLSNATLPSGTITTTGGVYRYAAGTLDTTTVSLGNVHVGTGGGNLTAAVKATNTAQNDGYSDNLGVNVSGLPAGMSYTAGAGVAAGTGSQQGGTLTISTSAPRQISSTLSALLVSNPTVTGLDTGHQVGSGSLLVTANLYSGLGTWSSPAGGNWADFSRWETSGGAPGTDAGFTTTDTATFGTAIGSTPATISVNVPVSLNALSFNNAGAGYTMGGSKPLSFAGASPLLSSSAGSHTISAPVMLNSNLSVAISGAGNVLSVDSFGGGNRTLTKTGPGTLAITGNSSGLTGSAVVNGGAVEIDGLFGGGVVVNSGGTLLGSGHIGGTISLYDGATISAGSASRTGTLSVDGVGTSLFSGGSQFSWDILSVAGTGSQDALAGSGFDVLHLNGPLTITATAANPIVISLNSLSAQGTDGAISGWNKNLPYQWTIATANGGISGFDPSIFRVDADEFFTTNGGRDTGYFTLLEAPDGRSVTLNYAVPEPTVVLTLSGTVLSALALRPGRRRRSRME